MPTKLPMPLLSGPHPSINTVRRLTQINGSSLSSPCCATINTNPLQSGPGGNNLARANLRVVLLDANKSAHATALTTTSQPQYTHKTDSDDWLRLQQPMLRHNQHKSTSVRPWWQRQPSSKANLQVVLLDASKTAHATALTTTSQPQ